MTTIERSWALHVERPMPEVVCVALAGVWKNEDRLPDPSEVWREIDAGPAIHRLTFDTSRVTNWDSGFVTFVIELIEEARARGIGLEGSVDAAGRSSPPGAAVRRVPAEGGHICTARFTRPTASSIAR